MNILKEIATAIRGGSGDLGETITDAQSTTVFQQEINDAKESLKCAKHDLTQIMAREVQTNKKIEAIQKDIEKNEVYVAEALSKNKETQALEIAGKIAKLETDIQHQHQAQQSYTVDIGKLKKMMEKTERQLKEYERQLAMVKTTENIQKATATIEHNFENADSNLPSAKESLQRIKQKQQSFKGRNNATQQIDGENHHQNLTDTVKHPGVAEPGNDAQAILARIKAQKPM